MNNSEPTYPTVDEISEACEKSFSMPPRKVDEQTAYSLYFKGFFAGVMWAIRWNADKEIKS